ncbi:MAG: hypothetical protein ACK5MR_02470 [Cumulibacter sp.]
MVNSTLYAVRTRFAALALGGGNDRTAALTAVADRGRTDLGLAAVPSVVT